MRAYIVGRNRVEICEVKKRDLAKTFFVHRQQLYMITPGNLVRMRYYDEDGHEIQQPEETIIFPEGASVAYDTLEEDAYYQEAVLPAIDLYRDVNRRRFRQAGVLQGVTTAARQLYPYAGLVITLAVVGWAMLSGG